MPKLNLSEKFNLINSDRVKNRFNFIQDPVLKSNIDSVFQYIIFLLILEEEYDLSKLAKHYIFKDMIVHSAVIVEALLHYKIKQQVNSGKSKIEELELIEEKYHKLTEVYKVDDETNVVVGYRTRKTRDLADTEDFKKINDCAKKLNIIDSNLHFKAENLRQMRNKVHLFALKAQDDKYDKSTIEQIFSDVNEIVEALSK